MQAILPDLKWIGQKTEVSIRALLYWKETVQLIMDRPLNSEHMHVKAN